MSIQLSGSLILSGSLTATGGITMSGSIDSASYAMNATSASYAFASTSASYALNTTSASISSDSSLLAGRDSGVFATTGSNTFVGNQTITGSIFGTGSLTINGCITATGQIVAQTINVQQVTSSVVYSCGDNIFGTALTNTQTLCGNVFNTGSLACFAGRICSNTLSVSSTTNLGGALIGTTACFGNTGTGDNVLLISNNDQSNTRLRITNTGSGGRTYSIVGGLNGANNSSLSIYDETASSTRLEINSAGIACFACQVCAPRFIANVSGCGCIAFFSSNGNIVFDNASISAIGNMGSNASQFSVSSRGCLTFRVGENGDPAAAPLRFLMDTNGVACFSCQICSPAFIGTSATIANSGTACTVTDVLTLSTLQSGPDSVCAGAGLLFTGNAGATVARIYSRGNMNFNNGSDLVFQTQVSAGGTPQCTVVINGATQHVGIGTFSPAYKLEVNGISAAALGFLINSGGYNSIASVPYTGMFTTEAASSDGFGGLLISSRTDAARPIIFGTSNGTNSVSRLRIEASGIACFACQICAPAISFSSNVNTGFTPIRICNPNSGASAYSEVVFFNNTSNQAGFFYNSSARSVDGGVCSFSMYNDSANGNIRIRTGNNIVLATGSPATDRLTINSSGAACFAGQVSINGNEYIYKSGGGGSPKQTVVGQITAAASGVAKKIAYVGFTHSVRVYVWATQSTAHGSSAIVDIVTLYGSSSGGSVIEANFGDVSDISITYDNGGSPAYTINVTLTYTGTAPTINYVIEGINHDNNIYTL